MKNSSFNRTFGYWNFNEPAPPFEPAPFNRTFGYWNAPIPRRPPRPLAPSIAPSGIETDKEGLKSEADAAFNRTFGYWNRRLAAQLYAPQFPFNRTFGYWNIGDVQKPEAEFEPSIAPSGIETLFFRLHNYFFLLLQSHLRVLKPCFLGFTTTFSFSFNRTFGYWNAIVADSAAESAGPSIAPSGIETLFSWFLCLLFIYLQSHLRVLKHEIVGPDGATHYPFNRTFGYWNRGRYLAKTCLSWPSIAPSGIETKSLPTKFTSNPSLQSHLRVLKRSNCSPFGV